MGLERRKEVRFTVKIFALKVACPEGWGIVLIRQEMLQHQQMINWIGVVWSGPSYLTVTLLPEAKTPASGQD